jgi:hypothetical protein
MAAAASLTLAFSNRGGEKREGREQSKWTDLQLLFSSLEKGEREENGGRL